MRSRSRVDAALAAAAIAFGAVTLSYPFGRDQALMFYVGREWILRGAVPYRDVFEHKTPFIYAVHAALVAIFGEAMWPIRALELVVAVATGWIAGAIAARSLDRPAPGARGVGAFAASVFYFGYLPFQDTGNCELWCAFFVGLALLAAGARTLRGDAGCVLAGLFVGAAIAAKPPSAALAPLVAYALVARVRGSRAAGRLAAYALASVAIVPGAFVLYFAAKGALVAASDIVIDANGWFVAHGRAAETLASTARESLRAVGWFVPFSYAAPLVCVFGIARARRRQDAAAVRAYAGSLAAAALTYVAVFAQGKFFVYHHALLVLPFAHLAATAFVDFARTFPVRVAAIGAPALAATIVLMTPRDVWLDRARDLAARALGRIDEDERIARFSSEYIDMASAAHAGAWLRAHADPHDELLVRTYEPEVYAFAKMRYSGRFFWTAVLTDPKRAYRRAAWLAEDRAHIEAARPRWVVAMDGAAFDLDTPAFFEALGYRRRDAFGRLVVLER